ncbi:hypothetical protein F5879DRAFT_1066210 [Lentinula edodes]|nr:hypothetical protein F5879DRAFT_1066210 [Lentinula edodes]
MFGGKTLFELRTALQLAEVDREGGISPHMTGSSSDTRDVSNLLGRAGFTLLTVDIDEVKELMDNLRDMGESNAVIGRSAAQIHRDTFAAASAIYNTIGWEPALTQPRPLERGTGKTNLKDVL